MNIIHKFANNKKELFLMALTVSVMACSEIKNKDPETQAIAQDPVENKSLTQKSLDPVVIEMKESDVPHQYQIAISWPDKYKKVLIENEGEKLIETNSTNQFLLDIKDNTKFDIRLYSLDSENPILIGSKKDQTPKDYTFNSIIDLKEDLEINSHRIFILNGTKIQTNGKNLKLKSDKLISDNAEVFSFQSGAKNGPTLNGASGGLVAIYSKVAVGNLKIQLRGQSGGDGYDGVSFTARAQDGSSGRKGDHECVAAKVGGISVGGPLKCLCTRNPTDGTPGANGEQGRPGIKAGDGGNSGKIIVEIEEPSKFVVEPFQDVGLGGRSGVGGPGQEGGEGGPAGDSSSNECQTAKQGPKGATGAKGIDATPSINGSIEISCISIGQGEGKCKI